MNKFLVITTINHPTEAIRQFSLLKDWNVIVVGDKKTPADWQIENVKYLSIEDQTFFNFNLPFNNYVRKMIGYIYAIQNGADIIADSDDDNYPLENWDSPFNNEKQELVFKKGFLNIYRIFSDEIIWPRGLPLRSVFTVSDFYDEINGDKVGIWQGLVNGDPDVDAIHRMIFNNKGIEFQKKNSVVLKEGAICPFNSQNTFFRKELFPLLYLPVTVNSRFSDILRGIVAQPIMWKAGYHLGFTSSSAMQIRNKHILMEDFKDEIPCYIFTEKVLKIVKSAIQDSDFLQDSLYKAYKALIVAGIVKGVELDYLTAWFNALQNNNEIEKINLQDWKEVNLKEG